MTHTLYVVGGEERPVNPLDRNTEWPPYQKALIAKVDLNAKRAQRVVEYVSPPEACASETPDILFKSGTLKNNHFYVCTKTEILIYSVPEFEKFGYISLPCFNDLHHVCPTEKGTLLVVATGLDLVIEMTEKGQILREWNVLGEPPWQRFSKGMDYRKIPSTKPHKSHPNYAFQVDKKPWVTRFEQRDAICLTDPNLFIKIGIEKPHDGIPYNDHVYFTTVDGHVVVVDKFTKNVEVFDLNLINGKVDIPLGWCRGIKVMEDYNVIIGFTSLRQTKYLDNLKWIKPLGRSNRASKGMPTRIAQYDLKRKELLCEFDLEHIGMNVVFSIH